LRILLKPRGGSAFIADRLTSVGVAIAKCAIEIRKITEPHIGRHRTDAGEVKDRVVSGGKTFCGIPADQPSSEAGSNWRDCLAGGLSKPRKPHSMRRKPGLKTTASSPGGAAAE